MEIQSSIIKKTYDLIERTSFFAENIFEFCKKIPVSTITNPLIVQLVKAGTSIGANFSEADVAGSKKDFRNKVVICRKESKETMYWLKLFKKIAPTLSSEIDELFDEAKQLTLIFSSILLK